MKKLEIQTNFTAGELSPLMYGLVDLDKYKNGMSECLNCLVLPQGPLQRRNGTQFINSSKSDSYIRLIRFQFSQTVAVAVELGNEYMRFYKDGGIILNTGTPVELSTPYLSSELFGITFAQFGKSMYLAHANHPPQVLTYKDDLTWTLQAIDFLPPATDQLGNKPAFTCTPGATTGLGVAFTTSGAVFAVGDIGRQIKNLNGDGIASIVGYTNNSNVPCDIIEDFPSTSAMTAGNWKMDLTPVAKIKLDGVTIGSRVMASSYYEDSALGPVINISGISNANPGVVSATAHSLANGDTAVINDVFGMTEVNNRNWTVKGATANTFTLANDTNQDIDTTGYTAYASGGTARKSLKNIPLNVFRADDAGRYLIANSGGGLITAVVDVQHVQFNMQKSMSTAADTSSWSLEDPLWSAANGYPNCVTICQQRLCFGGTTLRPQDVYMSVSGVFTSMGVGSGDSDAIQITMATQDCATTNWMASFRQELMVGTQSSELTLDSGGVAGPITGSTVTQQTRSSWGSLVQQPIVIGNELVYVQKSLRSIMVMHYDFLVDNYISDDLLFLCQHLSAGLVKEVAYAQVPNRQILAVCQDGSLLSGTYYKEQKITGWTKYTTNGLFESVCTINTGSRDEVWVSVNRTTSNTVHRYIERFDFGDGTSSLDGYSDSYLTYSVPKTISSISLQSTCTIVASGHGLTTGDSIKIFGGGMTQVIGKTWKVTVIDSNTITIPVNSSLFNTYGSGGTLYKLVTTISNLDHLEGLTVQIKADGGSHGDKVVSGGSITLDRPSYQVVVGLGYSMVARTLNKEYNIGIGSQQGQRTRWVRPILRLHNSAFPTLNGQYTPSRFPQDKMDNALGLFSGDVVYGGLDWDSTGQLTIQLDSPFPCVISGLFGSLDGGSQ